MTVIRPILQTFGGQILHNGLKLLRSSAIAPQIRRHPFSRYWRAGKIKSTSGSAQSPAKKTKSEKKTPTKKVQRTEKDITSGKEGPSAPIAPITVASNKLPQMTMHIDLQIHISPEASTEQIDAIFASMAKHLYK